MHVAKNSDRTNSVLVAKPFHADVLCCVTHAYFFDLLISKLSPVVILARKSFDRFERAFSKSVMGVLFVGAKFQMSWVAARRKVPRCSAVMANYLAFRDWANAKNVSRPAGLDGLPIYARLQVWVSTVWGCCCAYPALVWSTLINLSPKPFWKIRRESLRRQIFKSDNHNHLSILLIDFLTQFVKYALNFCKHHLSRQSVDSVNCDLGSLICVADNAYSKKITLWISRLNKTLNDFKTLCLSFSVLRSRLVLSMFVHKLSVCPFALRTQRASSFLSTLSLTVKLSCGCCHSPPSTLAAGSFPCACVDTQ